MTRQKTICPDCVGLMVHRLPVSVGVRAFTAGALGFVAAFFEERSEKCDECGLLKPYCFHYPSPAEDEPCVHCGVHEEHHANAGHKFRARIGSDDDCAHGVHSWTADVPGDTKAVRCTKCGLHRYDDCTHGTHTWADVPGSTTAVKCMRCGALSLRMHITQGCKDGVHSWEWEPSGHVKRGYLRCTVCRSYATADQTEDWRREQANG